MLMNQINETSNMNYFEIEKPEKYIFFQQSKGVRLRAQSGIQMLLFDNMAVNINGKNTALDDDGL